MFKVGERVIVEGSDQVYKVKEIQEDSNRIIVTSIYNGKDQRFAIQDVKKTVKNPAVLLETYGREWHDVVHSVLVKSKVKFKVVPCDRNRDAARFWVDAKKVTAAKKALDQHYEDEKNSKI